VFYARRAPGFPTPDDLEEKPSSAFVFFCVDRQAFVVVILNERHIFVLNDWPWIRDVRRLRPGMLHMIQRIAFTGIAVTAAVALLAAQSPQKVAFEVASVRLVETPTPSRRTQTDTRFDWVSVPVREVLLMAFRVEAFRLVVPDSVRTMWVEIHATLPPGATRQQVPEMLRTLVIERFGLVTHVESRPIEVGELTIGKGGLKMPEVQPVDDLKTPFPVAAGGPNSPSFDQLAGSPDNPTRIIITPGGGMREVTARTNWESKETGRGTMVYDATRATMEQLRDMISSSVGKPVIDKTGLTGLYQFRIELPLNTAIAAQVRQRAGINGTPLTVDAINSDPSSGSAFKAVETLGLKLEERRTNFDVLVVDKLEKTPTPN
jgi:uncharacterized protein (TIGR03435 family)